LGGSRRRALTGVLAATLGLLGPAGKRAAGKKKKKKKKPCPRCRKRKKSTCKAKLPDGAGCRGGTCQGGKCVAAVNLPPAATCSDTIQNGNESDVDCGGSCPRCLNTRRCTGPSDCASGYCASGVCQSCPSLGAAC